MKKIKKTRNSLIREVTRLPRALPFLAVTARKHRGFLEVFVQTGPRRIWRRVHRAKIATLTTTMPRG
jgi:hypothetical protein